MSAINIVNRNRSHIHFVSCYVETANKRKPADSTQLQSETKKYKFTAFVSAGSTTQSQQTPDNTLCSTTQSQQTPDNTLCSDSKAAQVANIFSVNRMKVVDKKKGKRTQSKTLVVDRPKPHLSLAHQEVYQKVSLIGDHSNHRYLHSNEGNHVAVLYCPLWASDYNLLGDAAVFSDASFQATMAVSSFPSVFHDGSMKVQ